ncbi:hypothetical protein AB0P32_03920 [Streptomyces sp. NPDC085995]|uniref:hypothetical protein n=1 Tax=Streptomyces sp. NPDC085995 TaxID=3154861 RepID=UPI00343DBB93
MSDDIVPREQAFAEARAVFDAALARIARDRAAGRLSPEHEAIVREAERSYAAQHGAAGRETTPNLAAIQRTYGVTAADLFPADA